jgi:three-Cys-motif partner protein
MKTFNPLINPEDDGLFIPEVREWSLEKYRLFGSYCEIFTSGMYHHWHNLVYIDLFAGAGYVKVKENGKIYYSSSLIALSLKKPFTKYILCEQDTERYLSLKERIKRDFSHYDVVVLNRDSNEAIDEILSHIPTYNKKNTVLPFCFVDPFSLNLHFNTIKTLGNRGLMDFLILQALHMDANRNLEKYLKDENSRIENYLGVSNWREQYQKYCGGKAKNFVKFLADIYKAQMTEMGYLADHNMYQIRSNEKNLPLYYLAFFSKHPRGVQFFKKIESYANPQLKLEL